MPIKYIILTINFLILLLISYILITIKLFKPDINDYKNNRIYKKILFSNLKKYIKSGDLLFFSSINSDVKTRSWINNRFPHVGMIIMINNKPFIIEIIDKYLMKPRQSEFISGVILTPVFDRIVNYYGSVYYSSLKTPLYKEQDNILQDYVKNMSIYKYNKISSIIYSLFTHSKKLDNYNRFCTEFIAEILDKLNISSKPLNSSKLNLPNEIFKLTDGKIYTNPIHILCDGLMVNKITEGSYMTYC
jgi:hypothetical protein